MIEVLSGSGYGQSPEERAEALLKVMSSYGNYRGNAGPERLSDMNDLLSDLAGWALNGGSRSGLWRQLTIEDLTRLLAEGRA
jgi:hypothetical protein